MIIIKKPVQMIQDFFYHISVLDYNHTFLQSS